MNHVVDRLLSVRRRPCDTKDRLCMLHRFGGRRNTSAVINTCFFSHTHIVLYPLGGLLKGLQQLTLADLIDAVAVSHVGVSEAMNVLIENRLVVLRDITVQLRT